MTINQMGRELTCRLVEAVGCDLQTAVRFFYNSELYGDLERLLASDEGVSTDVLFERLLKEFEGETKG